MGSDVWTIVGIDANGAQRAGRLAGQRRNASWCSNATALLLSSLCRVYEDEAPLDAQLPLHLRIWGLGSDPPFSAATGQNSRETGSGSSGAPGHSDCVDTANLPGEALTKFKLSKALMARASQLKEKASKAAEVRAMPATLGDKVLSAFLKNGQTLCGAYQIHRCGRSEDQCDALHKCAVVLRSARVCGGRHAAVDCHDKRSLKICNDDASKEEPKKPQVAKEGRLPQPKKRPQPKSPDYPPPSKRARDDQPVAGNKKEEAKFDRLATAKGKTAQRPTLILEHSNGGAIWLSGLPTVNTLEAFPAVSLQIVCFSEPLERRGGICCPGAQCLVLAPTDRDKRDSQWKEAWPLLRQTYFGGESTLIHCMAGRHRAAGIAVLLRSLLLDCTIEESASAIAAKRDIEVDKLVSTKHVAEWIWWTYRHATVGAPLPQLDGYMATERSQLHLRTIHDAPLCHHKQSTEKAAERLRSPLRSASLQEAVAWGRPWCSSCIAKAPAGIQTMIRDCWGRGWKKLWGVSGEWPPIFPSVPGGLEACECTDTHLSHW